MRRSAQGGLPRRSRRGDDLRDPSLARDGGIRDHMICRGPAGDMEGKCPRKGLGHLAREPVLCGIWRNLKVNNPSAVKAEHDLGVEQPAPRSGDHEHVNCHNCRQLCACVIPPG
jgi:hypothetical protein